MIAPRTRAFVLGAQMSITITATSTPSPENTSNGFGPGQVDLVLSLSAPAETDVSVDYRLRDGAAGDDDLLYLSTWFRNFGTVRFAPGEIEKTVSVEIRPDNLSETDESFAFEIYNPVGAVFERDVPVLPVLGVVLDDDLHEPQAPELFVTAPVVIARDESDFVSFDIHLSRPSDTDLSFRFETFGLEDHELSGFITFGAGETHRTLTLPVASSELSAGAHQLGLLLRPVEGDSIPAQSSAALLVPQQGDLPTLFVMGDTGAENVGPVDGRLGFTVVLSEASETAVTVHYFLTGGTADDLDVNSPFTDPSNIGTVTFAPGQTVATVHVAAQTDSRAEPDETLSLHLINPQGAVFADHATEVSALGIIMDNDWDEPRPTLIVSDAELKTIGDAQFAEFALFLSRPMSETATLTVQTLDGTAQAGDAYTAISVDIEIAAGETVARVRVPITDVPAGTFAGHFHLSAALRSDTLGQLPYETGLASLDRADLAQIPYVTARGLDTTRVEGQDTQVRFVVSLSHPSQEEASISYRLSTNESGRITFEPGETTRIITVDAPNDPLGLDTAIWLDLFDPTYAQVSPDGRSAQTIAVVRGPDPLPEGPQLFVTHSAVLSAENGDRSLVFELRLSRALDEAGQIEYSLHSGATPLDIDAEARSGSVILEAGQDRAFVHLPMGIEAPQTHWTDLMFSARLNGSDQHAWTDINVAPTQSPDLPLIAVHGGAVTENQGFAGSDLSFVIHLSHPSDEVVTVRYEAIYGTASEADFAMPLSAGTLQFEPGQTQTTVTFRTQFDAQSEPDETVFLRLSNPDQARFEGRDETRTAIGVLLDDDGPAAPVLAAADSHLSEGESKRVSFTLSRALDHDRTFEASLEYETASVDDIILHDAQVTFLAGQTTAYLTLSALEDLREEPIETLRVLLQDTAEADALDLNSSLRVHINNNHIDTPDAPIDQSGTADADILIGGGFGDTLRGFGGDDQLYGGGGDDFILPGSGNDVIFGGDGTDTISFVDAVQGLSVDMIEAQALSGSDTNTWSGVEHITGSIWADYVVTDASNNRIRSLGDYDWIVGSDGFDFIDGGDGRDMLSYVNAEGPVEVDLGTGRGMDGQAAGDRFVNIERLTGSVYSDRFFGSNGADDFRGLGGNDWFVGSDGGRDRYDGGTGRDTVAYSLAQEGVLASLTAGLFGQGQAALDLYTSIENLTGSSFDDVLVGDEGRNTLRGLYGEDTLQGQGGNDRLLGGASDDLLDGGAGWDVAVYLSSSSSYRINSNGPDVQVSALGGLRDGTDTLIDVEAIQFSDTLIFL